MPRISNTELPSESELRDILAKESQRFAVHYNYLQLHPDIFMPFKELCRKYGAKYDWLDTYEHINLTELDAHLRACFDTLETSILNQTGRIYTDVYDRLTANEMPQKADAIFVFGSPNDLRIRKAIALYKDKFADKIVISGHGPFYAKPTQSEAERMAKIATDNGVPHSALLLESQAITISDNVKRSLDLFEKLEFKPTKLLIVASPYALRRCMMDWYMFAPWDINIIPIAADSVSYDLTREGWTTTSRAIRVILNEYSKLVFRTKIELLRREHSN